MIVEVGPGVDSRGTNKVLPPVEVFSSVWEGHVNTPTFLM
jgi:hypothetical protein